MPYHIETSQFICNANQLTGFYMRTKLAFNGSLLIMRSAIELALLNFPVERSLPRSSFYLPINFSLNGSVELKKVSITLGKFVTNKIWYLSHYIKPSSYRVTSSLSRRSSVEEDYLSQEDRGKYLLKMAATKVMYDTVTRCLHYTLLMFVFCFKWV